MLRVGKAAWSATGNTEGGSNGKHQRMDILMQFLQQAWGPGPWIIKIHGPQQKQSSQTEGSCEVCREEGSKDVC